MRFAQEKVRVRAERGPWVYLDEASSGERVEKGARGRWESGNKQPGTRCFIRAWGKKKKEWAIHFSALGA